MKQRNTLQYTIFMLYLYFYAVLHPIVPFIKCIYMNCSMLKHIIFPKIYYANNILTKNFASEFKFHKLGCRWIENFCVLPYFTYFIYKFY